MNNDEVDNITREVNWLGYTGGKLPDLWIPELARNQESCRLIFIEYDLNGYPNAVDVERQFEKNGPCQESYYFDWSKKFGMFFWRKAGCGGDSEIGLAKVYRPSVLHDFWTASDKIYFDRGPGYTRKYLKAKGWEKLGYRRIDAPKMINDKSCNPFSSKLGYETESVYCEKCKDYFVRDEEWDWCDHLVWCQTEADAVQIKKHVGCNCRSI